MKVILNHAKLWNADKGNAPKRNTPEGAHYLFFVLLFFSPLVLPIPAESTLTTAGTIIRNGGDNGTTTYQDGISQPGDVILRYWNIFGTETVITSNSVSTLVLQGYGLSAFDKLQDQLLGGSRTIYYTYTITNTGSGTDTVTFSLATVPPDWRTTLIEDTNQDGIHQATETTTIGSVTLLARQSKYFFLQVIVPDGGNEGDRITTQITAFSSSVLSPVI